MGNAVENAAKGLELAFRHFELFLRQMTPGFIYLIAFHWSWGKWPDQEHVWMEVGAAPFLGCLIYALCKATVNRASTLRSVNKARMSHRRLKNKACGRCTFMSEPITCEWCREALSSIRKRFTRRWWRKKLFLSSNPDKEVLKVDFQRWLRRETQSPGLRCIQANLSTWATSTVFLQCAALAIFLAALTPVSWLPPDLWLVWESESLVEALCDLLVNRSACCCCVALTLFWISYRTNHQVTQREKELNAEKYKLNWETAEVENGKGEEVEGEWIVRCVRRAAPPSDSDDS